MNRVKTCFLIGVLTMLAACIPIPHMETNAPSVSGTLTHYRDPLAGAVVHYLPVLTTEAEPCRESEITAVTDGSGEFHFDEHREMALLFAPMADRLFAFTVCVEVENSFNLLWQAEDFGVMRSHFAIDCEMTSPVVDTPLGRGICQIADEKTSGD